MTGKSVRGIKILCTKDGGNSWQVCYKDNKSGVVFKIVTVSENIVLMTIGRNSLLRTDNRGKSWEFVHAPKRMRFEDAAFNSNGIGWAVSEKTFYRSTDKGKTWQNVENLQQSLMTHNWRSIDFAGNFGVTVSEDCIVGITYDGGKTWQEIKTEFCRDNKIPATAFDEHFGKVKLHSNNGIIFGWQFLYRISSIEQTVEK